jgi:hypothetical protein
LILLFWPERALVQSLWIGEKSHLMPKIEPDLALHFDKICHTGSLFAKLSV